MIAIEIEAPIVNHRIAFSSHRLPSNVEHAKIIVMYEEAAAEPGNLDMVALARAARASFPKRDPKQLRDEFDAMRFEWDGRSHGK